MTECFSNKWHSREPQCTQPAVWKGCGTYNISDDWTWCNDHAPQDPQYRIRLADQAPLSVPQDATDGAVTEE